MNGKEVKIVLSKQAKAALERLADDNYEVFAAFSDFEEDVQRKTKPEDDQDEELLKECIGQRVTDIYYLRLSDDQSRPFFEVVYLNLNDKYLLELFDPKCNVMPRDQDLRISEVVSLIELLTDYVYEDLKVEAEAGELITKVIIRNNDNVFEFVTPGWILHTIK